MKGSICTVLGMVGGAISALFGGWDAALATLVIFMVIDFFTGLIVACFFGKSDKTKNGGYNSKETRKGLCKKIVTISLVAVAYSLDLKMGSNFIRETVIIGFTVNEGMSIIENAALMGIPMPNAVSKMLEVLKESNEAKVKEEFKDAGKDIQNK